MNQPVRTSKSVYAIFGAGLVLGAVCMAGVVKGGVVTQAVASQDFKPRVISSTSVESMTELRNLDNSIANLADFVAPAVVDIRSTKTRQVGANGEREPEMGGEGSGFVIRPDGYIVTNDHVVGGFDKVEVILKDGREFPGTVTRAQDSDIAIVKINATNLPTLSFADSSKVRPGQMSMAVGAPFGLTNSVTVGHVSAIGRETQIENRNYPTLIQTDTAINMGNSGGPLVNIDGQVIGVNTAIYSPSGVNSGIGFAIPASQAKLIAEKLITTGKITRSMLGLIPTNLKDYQKTEKKIDGGAIVDRLVPDGPAAKGGVQKDDIIVRIGTTQVLSEIDLRNAMLEYAPGTIVPVEVIRGGDHKVFNVKLEAYKAAVDPTESAPQMRENPQQQFGIPKGFEIPKEFLNPFGGGNDDQQAPSTTIPNDGHVHLGVKLHDLDADVRSEYNIPSGVKGVVIVEVVQDSLAESLGLQAGDVITQFGGNPVVSAEELTKQVRKLKSGAVSHLHYVRYSTNGSVNGEVTVRFK